MTEYWFGFHNGKPHSVHRIVKNQGELTIAEFFNFKEKLWLPDDTIIWYTWSGEIGYEPTTEEFAMKFIESRLAEEAE